MICFNLQRLRGSLLQDQHYPTRNVGSWVCVCSGAALLMANGHSERGKRGKGEEGRGEKSGEEEGRGDCCLSFFSPLWLAHLYALCVFSVCYVSPCVSPIAWVQGLMGEKFPNWNQFNLNDFTAYNVSVVVVWRPTQDSATRHPHTTDVPTCTDTRTASMYVRDVQARTYPVTEAMLIPCSQSTSMGATGNSDPKCEICKQQREMNKG